MKLYSTELNLILDLVTEMHVDTTIEVYGDISFNLTRNGVQVGRKIDNDKLTIMTYGGDVYINEINNLVYQFELLDYHLTLDVIKSFLWADLLYFNKITVNNSNVPKFKFIINLLDMYMDFLKCKCLVVDFMIRERVVSLNYYKGGRVQRSYMDRVTHEDKPFMLVFETSIEELFNRHKSLRLIGVAPNREIAYPEAYYKQLARVSNMKELGSNFRFRKAEDGDNLC